MPNRVTLESVCSLIVDCEHKTAPEASPGAEYAYSVGTPNIRGGRIIFANAKRVDQPTYESWTVRATPSFGDIILTREAPVGEAGFIDGQNRICLGQRTVLLRPDPLKSDSRYLHYKLLSPAMQTVLLSQAEGSTVAHLNVRDIRNLDVGPLPPLHEQRAIAAILGVLDDKIVVNDCIAESALDLALASYGNMASVSGWSRQPTKDVAKWLSGGTPKTSEPSYWDGDIPWISARSLKVPWIFESDRNVTSLGAANGTRTVPAGTVIFVVRGSSLDSEFRVGLTVRQVTFGQDCKALLPRDGVDPYTLLVALKANSSEILKLVDHTGHGAGRLSTDLIENFEVALPDSAESGKAAHAFKPLVEAGAQRKQENRKLSELRDKLLPKLMSGRVRIRDAEKAVEDAV